MEEKAGRKIKWEEFLESGTSAARTLRITHL